MADGADDEEKEDGVALWREAVRHAVPLPQNVKIPLPLAPRPPRRERMESPAPVAGKSMPVDQAGLDRRTDERLRRGLLPLEGQIDLHGMSQDRALAALDVFIRRSYEQGRRCVLVVTGKGAARRRPDGISDWTASQPGILSARVPEWLRAPPLGGLVLRFYPARPRDGGEGALYVLLRRKR